MTLCPHCMRPAEGKTCPHCGKNTDWKNPAHLLAVGTVLTGGASGRHYQIGAYLGQGGFGVTYTALEQETGRRTAVKEYFPTYCARRGAGGVVEPLDKNSGQDALFESGRYSFVQEARMLAALEGMPSVVQGLDYLEVNNTAYLVMEYLDGTPLYRIVDKQGPISAAQLLPRLYPLLRDMGQLHATGVIHRDVSPDNVMWMEDGTLKLLDFGAARIMETGKSMTVALKHGFAPVEQYRTHGQGPWTDVYALAATIYYCLTGKIPPSAVDRVVKDELASPRALGAAITQEEEEALLCALTVQPQKRLQNMDQFAQRLFPQQYAADHRPPPVSGPSSRLTPPNAPRPNSNPAGSSPRPSAPVSGSPPDPEWLAWVKEHKNTLAVLAGIVGLILILQAIFS